MKKIGKLILFPLLALTLSSCDLVEQIPFVKDIFGQKEEDENKKTEDNLGEKAVIDLDKAFGFGEKFTFEQTQRQSTDTDGSYQEMYQQIKFDGDKVKVTNSNKMVSIITDEFANTISAGKELTADLLKDMYHLSDEFHATLTKNDGGYVFTAQQDEIYFAEKTSDIVADYYVEVPDQPLKYYKGQIYTGEFDYCDLLVSNFKQWSDYLYEVKDKENTYKFNMEPDDLKNNNMFLLSTFMIFRNGEIILDNKGIFKEFSCTIGDKSSTYFYKAQIELNTGTITIPGSSSIIPHVHEFTSSSGGTISYTGTSYIYAHYKYCETCNGMLDIDHCSFDEEGYCSECGHQKIVYYIDAIVEGKYAICVEVNDVTKNLEDVDVYSINILNTGRKISLSSPIDADFIPDDEYIRYVQMTQFEEGNILKVETYDHGYTTNKIYIAINAKENQGVFTADTVKVYTLNKPYNKN